MNNLPEINRDRIDQLRRMSESNGKAIAAMTEQLCTQRDTNFDLVKSNSQSIRDLIASLHKLNTATQSNSNQVAAQQQAITEFARTLGKMSDRIEKQHQQTQHQLAQLSEQVQFLHRSYISLQTETINMLEKFASDS